MKVVLINARPAFPQAVELEPLNLGYLSAYLGRHGHSCRVIHQTYRSPLTNERLLDEIRREDVELVGFTTYHSNIQATLELCRRIKESTEARTVLGGSMATALPDLALRDEVDFVVRGEGEQSLLSLVQALEARRTDLSDLPGLVFRTNGALRCGPPAERIRDLDALPFPDRRVAGGGARHMAGFVNILRDARLHFLITSRGCPNACQYCTSERMWQRNWFARSPGNVLEEARSLVADSALHVLGFVDQDIAVRKEHTLGVLEALSGSGLNVRWFGETIVPHLDEELIAAMGRSGCFAVFMGLESGSESVLTHVHKAFDLTRTREMLRALGRRNIYTICAFLVGLPWDTRETLRETRRFIRRLPADLILLSYVHPYPGTGLHDLVVREGWIDGNRLVYTPRRLLQPHVRTYSLTKRQLRREFIRSLLALYLSPFYWWHFARTTLAHPRRALLMVLGFLSLVRLGAGVFSYNLRNRFRREDRRGLVTGS